MEDNKDKVMAFIEVKMAPEMSEGYDRIARRIIQYDDVESLYLLTGSNDLMVTLTAESVQGVAVFVNEHLAPIAGVLSTETHFLLKKYKEQGRVLVNNPNQEERISFV